MVNLNIWLEKMMPIMIPVSLIIGVFFSDYLIIFEPMIPWLFGVMTFAGSITINFYTLGNAFNNICIFVIMLFVSHIVMPLLAWLMCFIFFQGDLYTLTGYIILMSVPTGIVSFLWTGFKKGDTGISLASVLLGATISPLVVTLTLSIVVGSQIEINIASLFIGLVFMILFPSLSAVILNSITDGKIVRKVGPTLSTITKIGLSTIVLLNGAVVAPFFKNTGLKLIPIATGSFFIAILGYITAIIASKIFKIEANKRIPLIYAVGMRNIGAAATIAIAYFPPPVSIPVVSGMMFQQILAALVGKLYIDKKLKLGIEISSEEIKVKEVN